MSFGLDESLRLNRISDMESGADQLRDWMRRRGFKSSDAARYLEMDEPYISVLINGKRTPGLDNAIKLERLTGIPVEAWASSHLSESENASSEKTKKNPVLHGDNA
jgi:plasmid maintenance system antidote protein VapI